MTASGLVSEEVQPRPPTSKPRGVTAVAGTGLVLAILGIAMMVAAAIKLRNYNGGGPISTAVGVILVIVSLYPLWPSLQSFKAGPARHRPPPPAEARASSLSRRAASATGSSATTSWCWRGGRRPPVARRPRSPWATQPR